MLCIGIVAAGVCAFLVLYWWSEGMLDASEAIILAIIYCGLAFGTFASHTWWQSALAFLCLCAAGGYTFYSFRLCGLRSFYKARCREYMSTISADPTNRAAREYLAKALYTMGELDRAIDEMEVAVQMGSELEIQYTLNDWKREQHSRDSLNPTCRWCRTENARGLRKCVKCGADLPYRSPLNQWIAGGRTAKSRYYLILTAGGALLVVSLVISPRYAFVPAGLVLLALAGWSLVSKARS